MQKPTPSGDCLLVKIQKECALACVHGRGSFKNAPSLKRFSFSAFDRGCSLLLLDMARCCGMDSTFMGVLAGIASRLKSVPDGRLVAINLSAKNLSLLSTLGLDRLIEVHGVDGVPDLIAHYLVDTAHQAEEAETDGIGKRNTLETMLDAHRELADVSEGNLDRFKDVINYLEQDLRQLDEV
jgi:anti-sigma B factor antagonist